MIAVAMVVDILSVAEVGVVLRSQQ